MAARDFPRPSPFVIAQSVITGLKIPAIEIDPRNNFVRGAFVFASDIDKLEMGFKSWKKPLQEVRDTIVIPSVRENFAQEGRPKWAPLKPQTITNRMYMGYPRGPILERSSKLKRIATQKNIWDIVSGVGREGYDMLSLRTEFLDGRVPYAEFHQLGAGVRRNRKIGEVKTRITRSGKSSTSFRFREPRVEAGESTRTFRLPPRPFIQLTVEEEAEIYAVFYNFMSQQVDKFWGPETKGL
jgi:phage gpG-like protein